MKPLILFFSASAIVATLSIPASAQDADISPRVASGQIVTDAHNDATGTTSTNVRVFAWEFGEVPADPFVIGDPGFNAFPGSGLAASSSVGIRVQDGLGYWDGTGPVTFGTAPNSETMTFTFGTQSRTVGAGTGLLPDMFFGSPVTSTGVYHEHINTFLNGTDGNAIPASSDGVEASAGIYLVEFSLVSNDSATAPSPFIFAVFNNGLSSTAFDQAIDHARSTLVPEPSSAVLIIGAVGMISLCGLRRYI